MTGTSVIPGPANGENPEPTIQLRSPVVGSGFGLWPPRNDGEEAVR